MMQVVSIPLGCFPVVCVLQSCWPESHCSCRDYRLRARNHRGLCTKLRANAPSPHLLQSSVQKGRLSGAYGTCRINSASLLVQLYLYCLVPRLHPKKLGRVDWSHLKNLLYVLSQHICNSSSPLSNFEVLLYETYITDRCINKRPLCLTRTPSYNKLTQQLSNKLAHARPTMQCIPLVISVLSTLPRFC